MRKFSKLLGAFLLFFLLTAFSFTGAKAAEKSFEIYYTNSETGYVVAIYDGAGLFSTSELGALAMEMQTATAYGNIVLYTTYQNNYGDTARLGDAICSYFSYSSTTVFIIDMDLRYLRIQSSGSNEKNMTTSKANSIADNIYSYASDGNYYRCAMEAFEQINTVLDGGHIAQPMKYISNALFAIMLALLINYFIAKGTAANRKMGEKELFSNLSQAYLRYDNFDVQHTYTEKHYSPSSQHTP